MITLNGILAAMTTLKIDDAVRDRLRARAQRHGRTMGEEVAALVESAEQAEMWATYGDARRSLSTESQDLLAEHAAMALRDATERHGRAGAW